MLAVRILNHWTTRKVQHGHYSWLILPRLWIIHDQTVPILPPKYFCIHSITCTFVVTLKVSSQWTQQLPLNALLSLHLSILQKRPCYILKKPSCHSLGYSKIPNFSSFLPCRISPNSLHTILNSTIIFAASTPTAFFYQNPIEAISILRNACSMELLNALPFAK